MADEIKGMAFPFRIDPETGGVAATTEAAKLRQNVSIILNTRRGERPMLREFGSGAHALLQEPNGSDLAELLADQVRQALIQWEPRIVVTAADVVQGEGETNLRLGYVSTNQALTGELLLPMR
jgi:uncharacterized protein